MQRRHVRLRKQRVQIDIRADGAPGVVRIDVICQNAHAHRPRDAALRLADAAKADDADRLALQLDERVVPIAPVGVVRPVTGVYTLAVVTDVVADLQQQRDGELADRRRAVGRHVHDGDTLFAGIIIIDHVVARRQNSDKLDIRALIKGLA